MFSLPATAHVPFYGRHDIDNWLKSFFVLLPHRGGNEFTLVATLQTPVKRQSECPQGLDTTCGTGSRQSSSDVCVEELLFFSFFFFVFFFVEMFFDQRDQEKSSHISTARSFTTEASMLNSNV